MVLKQLLIRATRYGASEYHQIFAWLLFKFVHYFHYIVFNQRRIKYSLLIKPVRYFFQ